MLSKILSFRIFNQWQELPLFSWNYSRLFIPEYMGSFGILRNRSSYILPFLKISGNYNIKQYVFTNLNIYLKVCRSEWIQFNKFSANGIWVYSMYIIRSFHLRICTFCCFCLHPNCMLKKIKPKNILQRKLIPWGQWSNNFEITFPSFWFLQWKLKWTFKKYTV